MICLGSVRPAVSTQAPVLILLAFLLTGFIVVPPPTHAQTDTVTIGVVVDGPWFRNDEIRGLFEQEIRVLLEDDATVRFPAEYFREGDWTATGILRELDALLAADDVDAVIAMGVKAGSLAPSRSPLPKPVIAPFIIDAAMLGLTPTASGGSGIGNFTYMATPGRLEHDLAVFHDIHPFQHIAILMAPTFAEDLPHLSMAMEWLREEYGAGVDVIPLRSTAEATLAALPEGVDAVTLTMPGDMPEAEHTRLIEQLTARGIPVHSMLGRYDVERGALSTMLPDEFFFRRARRTAINLQRILMGENAADLPVAVAGDRELVINMASARELGIYPDWALLTEAELINASREDVTQIWDLGRVVREAVRVNLELEAERRGVEAGESDVDNAWANLLPQLEVGASAVYIDEDRAEASFGSAAEATYSGTATITQLIFSEEAWANVSIQKSLQRSRLEELRSLSTDIAADAAVAYLNVLRANAFETIQEDNLEVTRANLELAEVRQAVGVAGPSELYRWQAEIASDQQAVITANMQRNLAEMQFNRILHRPIEESFTLDDVSLLDDELGLTDPTIQWLMSNPWNFKVLRNFFAQYGVEANPLIRQVDATLEAQERLLESRTRRFYAPTIVVQGQVEQIFERDGITDATALLSALPPDLLQDLQGASVPTQDDLNWSVGINASLPLFLGGSRIHDRAKAKLELEQLRTRRAALAEGIEQQIRTALHQAGASYASIDLARDAADAAARSLDVVQDAYAQGTVSIIELLDAQNAARVTEQAAADAVYTFLIDYFSAQRAVGGVVYLLDEGESEEIVRRLNEYFAGTGTPVDAE